MLAVKVLIYKITDFNACHQTPNADSWNSQKIFPKILYMRLDFMTEKNEKGGKIKMYQTQKQHIDLTEQGKSKTYCSKKRLAKL